MPTTFTRRDFLTTSAAGAACLATRPAFAQATDPTDLTIAEAQRLVRRGDLSPVDLVEAYTSRIRRLDARLNAFVTVTEERALERARALEAELAAGRWRGPLHGIPIGLKDNIDTAGVRTTAGSAVYADRVPDEDAEMVTRDGESLGEIIVRGNVVMKGYYNDPDATAAAMGDGWFHSGDAAVMHPDGYIEIRDRFKDVIISGGENISSVEVEGCLLRHPAVQEAAVVGMPHEKWGESPHAFVVLRDGAETTADELKLHVRENLAHFKTPQWVSFIDDLPKTATGKVQKFVLRGGRSAIARQ